MSQIEVSSRQIGAARVELSSWKESALLKRG